MTLRSLPLALALLLWPVACWAECAATDAIDTSASYYSPISGYIKTLQCQQPSPFVALRNTIRINQQPTVVTCTFTQGFCRWHAGDNGQAPIIGQGQRLSIQQVDSEGGDAGTAFCQVEISDTP